MQTTPPRKAYNGSPPEGLSVGFGPYLDKKSSRARTVPWMREGSGDVGWKVGVKMVVRTCLTPSTNVV